MSFREIEKILERYFNGETSLSEERELKEFFLKENIPDHLKVLKDQFVYFHEAEKERELDHDFDEKILKTIRKEKTINLSISRKTRLYLFSGAAACILILMTVFYQFDYFSKRIEDTLSDPQIAYREAQKVMMFVSKKFNKGTDQLEPVSKVDKGIEELKNVAKFDEGLTQATKLEKYNKLNNVISKPAER